MSPEREELLYQIWDLRNFLTGIAMMHDEELMRNMAAQALARNSEPGVQRLRQFHAEPDAGERP